MAQAKFYYKDPAAPRPNRPNHIGVAVLLEWQGRYLMEYRADSDFWCFIGGGLWIDETLARCAQRETREETGICLLETDFQFVRLYDDPSRIAAYPDGNVLRVITALYRAAMAEEPALVCSEESRALRFFAPQELAGLPVAPTHRDILGDILAGRV